jgi:hypothetical protein
MSNPAVYVKAILAAVSAAVASLVTALDDGNITTQEGLIAVGAFLGALGVVYVIPNRPIDEG